MENEVELRKEAAQQTDDGFSEKVIDLKVDRAAKSQQIMQGGNLFVPQKKAKTVFQAQKDEEK